MRERERERERGQKFLKGQIEFGNPSNLKVEQSIKVTFSPRNLVVLFLLPWEVSLEF